MERRVKFPQYGSPRILTLQWPAIEEGGSDSPTLLCLSGTPEAICGNCGLAP